MLGYNSLADVKKSSLQTTFEQQNSNLNPIDNLIARVFGGIDIPGLSIAGLDIKWVGILSIIILSLSVGYGAIYILPAVILWLFLNYFVFPLSFIFDATLDPMLKYVFFGFFNLITVLAVLTFIRGDA